MKIDVVLATESWLTSTISSSELKLNDYDIFRNDRSSRGGGVFIAVKKDLCGEFIESSDEVESIFVKVNIKGRKSIILGSVYRPPPSSYDYCSKSVNQIYKILNKFKSSVFCIGGDFNLPDIDWINSEIVGTQYPLIINQLYLDMSFDLAFNI